MARSLTPKEGKPIEFDPNFHGPLKNRSCTDIICLFLFIVFIGCWIGVGIFAYSRGDPDTLLKPRDSNGSRCGFDPHVKDKPNLLFFDLTKCLNPNVAFTGCKTPQVCVAKCPTENFVMQNDLFPLPNKKLICWYDVGNTDTLSDSDKVKLIKEGKCAKYYIKSEPAVGRCIPLTKDLDENFKEIISLTDLKKAVNNVEVLKNTEKFGHDVSEDLKAAWPEIVGGLLIAIFMCMLYILIMRWIASVMVWLSMLGSVVLLGVATYFCAINYKYYKEHPKEHEDAETVFTKYSKTKEFWLTLLIIVGSVLAILLLVLIFLRKRILLAIALIKEGSKAVSAVTSTLFFPIVPWLLQMAVIAYAIGVGLFLSTTRQPQYEMFEKQTGSCSCDGPAKDYKNGSTCTLDIYKQHCRVTDLCSCAFTQMDSSELITFVHLFNVFAFFWGVFFVTALGEMILAATFATWYWTFQKKDVPFFTLSAATSRTLRYHIGTLAFGSLIIAICRMIRVALEYIDHKLKKYENPFTKAILCCLKCFFWCLENFLKFINKNAYIMCAIHGKNFCASARDAFNLLIRNIVRVFVLDKVTDFLFFLSKFIVTLGVASIVYSIIEFVSDKKLNYPIAPVVLVAICTYLIATVFFSVYTMAVDTLFLCFLEDCERNDGSAQRPYYMSKNLMQVLGKKNKTS